MQLTTSVRIKTFPPAGLHLQAQSRQIEGSGGNGYVRLITEGPGRLLPPWEEEGLCPACQAPVSDDHINYDLLARSCWPDIKVISCETTIVS